MTIDPATITCAVTGATGYVGGVIVKYLCDAGFPVVQLQRQCKNKSTNQRTRRDEPLFRYYALQDEVAPELLKDIDVLIHCAYDFSALKWSKIEQINVQGSFRLFDVAKHAGVKRIIFISSLSSFETSKSNYGKAKLKIEQRANEFDLIVVRPGLVYGKRPGGMVGALNRLLTLPFPILPMVGSGKHSMLLVHENDLGELIVKLCSERKVPIGSPIIAGAEQAKTFRNILQILARIRGKKVLLVPVPWQLIWTVLKFAQIIGLRLRLRSDSLVALVNQNPSPDFTTTRKLGVHFRTFNESTIGCE